MFSLQIDCPLPAEWLGSFLASINNFVYNLVYIGIWMDESPEPLQKEVAYSLHTVKV